MLLAVAGRWSVRLNVLTFSVNYPRLGANVLFRHQAKKQEPVAGALPWTRLQQRVHDGICDRQRVNRRTSNSLSHADTDGRRRRRGNFLTNSFDELTNSSVLRWVIFDEISATLVQPKQLVKQWWPKQIQTQGGYDVWLTQKQLRSLLFIDIVNLMCVCVCVCVIFVLVTIQTRILFYKTAHTRRS